MAKTFPLYDTLKASTEKDVVPNHASLCTAIGGASKEHATFIYALIYHHYTLNNKPITSGRSMYGEKILHGGRGVTFSANELPPVLLKILNGYITRK